MINQNDSNSHPMYQNKQQLTRNNSAMTYTNNQGGSSTMNSTQNMQHGEHDLSNGIGKAATNFIESTKENITYVGQKLGVFQDYIM